MIEYIRLRNFQSHKDTTIKFSEGVNALVGLSDSGKSAVLRGLLWVITNKPSGEEFRSTWGGDTTVEVGLLDVAVERGRTNSDNYYAIKYADFGYETKYFRAFGQGAPPSEIVDLFNMNDLNVGAQMDSPFLISANAGEVAQVLNKAVNLDIIDVAISNVRKKKMEVDRQLKSAEENVENLSEVVASFDYLSEMEADVERYEALKDKRASVCAKIRDLKATVSKIYLYDDTLKKFNGILSAEKPLQAALSTQDKQSLCLDKITRLSRLIDQIVDRVADSDYHHQILCAEDSVNKAVALNNRIDAISKSADRLDNLRSRIRTTGVTLDTKKQDIQDLEQAFRAEMPEICPLCGNSSNTNTSAPGRSTRGTRL